LHSAALQRGTRIRSQKTQRRFAASKNQCQHAYIAKEDSAARTRAPDRCKTKSPLVSGPSSNSANLQKSGAGEGIRTLDPDLGKVVLYH
jgi:hypothetical protein